MARFTLRSRRALARVCSPVVVVAAFGVLAPVARGQVVFDGTLGPARALTGPQYQIDAEAGQLRGGNLFHSFSEFNVGPSEIVGFFGPAEVKNVLARVTGQNPSTIDGTVASFIPGANLFIINPRGITLGNNARIVVDGAFIVTSADFVRLGDGGRFDAATPGDSVLTTAPVSAFGFLGARPAPIRVESAVSGVGSEVAGPVTIAGGEVTIANALVESGGAVPRVNLVAAGGPGEVGLDPADPDAGIDVSTLPQRAAITVDGSLVLAERGTGRANSGAGDSGGGGIFIRGGDLRVDNQSVVGATALADAPGGPVDVELTGVAQLAAGARLGTSALAGGRSGDVRVAAREVRVTGGPLGAGTLLSTATEGAGNSGDLTIRADVVAVEVDPGTEGAITTLTSGPGSSGQVNVLADQVRVAGVRASIGSSTVGDQPGRAGDVRVRARDVRLTRGGRISAFPTGAGSVGSLDVEAADLVLVSGSEIPPGRTLPQPSAIDSSGDASLGGSRGVRVAAPTGRVRLEDRGEIGASTRDPDAAPIDVLADVIEVDGGVIDGTTSGAGTAAPITVAARVLELNNGGRISTSTTGTGNAGSISIRADEAVRLRGDSRISVRAFGFAGASAGSIDVTSPVFEATGGGLLISEALSLEDAATPPAGGPLTITADRILFDGAASGIASSTAVVAPGARSGNGGPVELTAAESIVFQRGASIISDVRADAGEADAIPPGTETTARTGRGGDVTLRAPLVRFADRDGDARAGVSSSTALKTPGTGDGGNVVVFAERFELAGGAVLRANTEGVGNGGSINITAGDVMIDGASLQAASTFAGDPAAGLTPGAGGSLSVDASRSVVLRNNAEMSVTALAGNGGGVRVAANERIRLTNSRIITRAGQAGGDISLGTRNDDTRAINPFVILFDASEINASAIAGNGGNIRIVSDEYVTSTDTLVTATSEQSNPGEVDVSAAYTELAGGLVRLPGSLANAQARLQEQCGLAVEGVVSSFIATGRGGSPLSPAGVQPSFGRGK